MSYRGLVLTMLTPSSVKRLLFSLNEQLSYSKSIPLGIGHN